MQRVSCTFCVCFPYHRTAPLTFPTRTIIKIAGSDDDDDDHDKINGGEKKELS